MKHIFYFTEIEGKEIRVEYSITKRAHTPTPGLYLGYPGAEHRRDGDYRCVKTGFSISNLA